jgi:hypothetical protein
MKSAPSNKARCARPWSKGRAVSLKRLRFESEQFDFLTPQDIRAAEAITVAHRNYQSTGLTYEIDPQRAAPHWSATRCCSGPTCRTCAWKCWPASRNCWSAQPGNLELRLHPPIPDDSARSSSARDANRLRVVSILDEHRKIAAIVGDALNVPARAEAQVLSAISAISSW